MIIVTGTRRSGTSVWMQILEQGGIRILGERFPADWKSFMEDANRNGFYESTLVQGINFQTNPDPKSGAWIPPQNVMDIGVKIFADGLVKTDYSYISKVIYTVREWRECEASRERMEDIKRRGDGSASLDQNSELWAKLPVGFAWWKANFALVKDMRTRRYPVAAFSYAALLQDPEKQIQTAFEWLGAGNAEAAANVVDRSLRTQEDVSPSDIGHDYAEVFDELYEVLHASQAISPEFYEKLVQTDTSITQDIEEILAE